MHDDSIPLAERRGFFAWFTQNHVASKLVALTFAVAGLAALLTGRVRREVFPELAPNVVTVQVVYPGASPDEVEHGVCMRVEEVVEGVTGVDKITSSANEGVGLVVIETLQDADIDRVLDDVKNRVDAITNFPGEIEEPVVSRLIVRKEVINVSISGDVEERTLKELAERARDDLAGLPQVSQVEVSAVRPYEISIELGEAAMRRHGLTFDAVADAVRRGSLDLPAGAIKADAGQTLLRVKGQAYRGDEFAALVLLTRPDGTRVRLGDVATVVDGFADDDLIARFDGRPTALLKVFRVGDQDAIVVTQAVRDWVAGQGRRLLPDGVSMTTWRDESVILKSRIDLLVRNALQGLVLVFVILALFLQLRLAMWVALGIPVSFLGAVALLPTFDVTLNMISLFAFLLVLGIVVDDAIVVGENVVLHRKAGLSPLHAALKASREVRVPVLASVLTTVAAFTPMLFAVPGADAQIWRVIPLIVIPVLLISLIESQLCLPGHLAAMRADDPTRRPWLGARLLALLQRLVQGSLDWLVQRTYEPFLRLSLRWRYVTIAAAIVVLMLVRAGVMSGQPRFVFFPTVDGDNIVASLTMPQGTPVAVTARELARIEQAARDICAEFDREQPGQPPLLQHMLATVGSQPYAVEQARNGGQRDAQFQSGSHLAELNVQLPPSEQRETSSDRIMSRLRDRVGTVPDAIELRFTTSFFSTGKDIDVELYHAEEPALRAAVDDLVAELRRLPEVKDVSSSFRLGKEEIELAIRDRAEPLGLGQRDLARQVRQAFYGEEAQRVQRGRDDVKVMVRYPEQARRSLHDLSTLRVRTPAGDEVPIEEVATLTSGRAYSTITRVDRKRALRVSGEIDENDPDADAEAINRRLRETVLPALVQRHPGLSWAFEGDQKKKTELLLSLAGGFLIALFLIYALMAIPLRSFAQPFLIMTAIPFGVAGAIGGHLLLGFDLSILSMFGVIALSGVVVNDNIVLVDWINQRREQHDTLLQAITSAGRARFRPILLTSLTTFGGLTPLLLEKSVQARFLVPMAISLGFGVLFATAISLVLVPSLYMVLDDLRRAWRWLYGPRQA
ncbi:MAG: efflux RND transporter permease subunit [Planctomycetes bacterium]|nr:efflux RND transporter permease subunit [Planctomycetota bacterium]MCC7398460.1 efflux RND transporter permease subunit [Planctomycetota bacterium]